MMQQKQTPAPIQRKYPQQSTKKPQQLTKNHLQKMANPQLILQFYLLGPTAILRPARLQLLEKIWKTKIPARVVAVTRQQIPQQTQTQTQTQTQP